MMRATVPTDGKCNLYGLLMNVSEGIPELTECPSGKLKSKTTYDHKYPWGPSV